MQIFFRQIYYYQKNISKYHYSSVTINISSLIFYSYYLIITQIPRKKKV